MYDTKNIDKFMICFHFSSWSWLNVILGYYEVPVQVHQVPKHRGQRGDGRRGQRQFAGICRPPVARARGTQERGRWRRHSHEQKSNKVFFKEFFFNHSYSLKGDTWPLRQQSRFLFFKTTIVKMLSNFNGSFNSTASFWNVSSILTLRVVTYFSNLCT